MEQVVGSSGSTMEPAVVGLPLNRLSLGAHPAWKHRASTCTHSPQASIMGRAPGDADPACTYWSEFSRDAAEDCMIGRTVTHFRIVERLGAGGMGVVYRAEDILLHRQVALKFLPEERARDEESRTRLRREAEAASSLDHPNICTIYEIGETEDGQLFIAMPCYEGETLAARIARGPLPLADATAIAEQMARGLVAAHAAGLIHRDLKPSNIFLTRDGGPKILDFGLVVTRDATRMTQAGTTLGTIDYMSPEQVRGDEAGPSSDLWALGCILYEAITGRPPFHGEQAQATVHAILGLDPVPLTSVRTGIPLELERIVSKALRKDPQDRYRHADEFEADLRAVRADLDPRRTGQTPVTGTATTVTTETATPHMASGWGSKARRRSGAMWGLAAAYRGHHPRRRRVADVRQSPRSCCE